LYRQIRKSIRSSKAEVAVSSTKRTEEGGEDWKKMTRALGKALLYTMNYLYGKSFVKLERQIRGEKGKPNRTRREMEGERQEGVERLLP